MTLRRDMLFPPAGINMLCQPLSSHSGQTLFCKTWSILHNHAKVKQESHFHTDRVSLSWETLLSTRQKINQSGLTHCVCARVCAFKLKNTCTFFAISFCHRCSLGRWLIENAQTAVALPFPFNIVTVRFFHLWVCMCIHFTACRNVVTGITCSKCSVDLCTMKGSYRMFSAN